MIVEILRKSSGLLLPPGYSNASAIMNSSTIGNFNSNCAPEGKILLMNEMSVWWQAIQFTLVAISEALLIVTSYDLFYSEVSASMRSVCQALNLLAMALGSMVGGGFNSIFSPWILDNLNNGRLELVFAVLAGLSFIALIVFAFTSKSFKQRKRNNALEVCKKMTEIELTKESTKDPFTYQQKCNSIYKSNIGAVNALEECTGKP